MTSKWMGVFIYLGAWCKGKKKKKKTCWTLVTFRQTVSKERPVPRLSSVVIKVRLNWFVWNGREQFVCPCATSEWCGCLASFDCIVWQRLLPLPSGLLVLSASQHISNLWDFTHAHTKNTLQNHIKYPRGTVMHGHELVPIIHLYYRVSNVKMHIHTHTQAGQSH